MQGIVHGEVRDVIVRAFNADAFDMFLYQRLDFDRRAEVADGPFRKVVDDVLRHAEENGWDPILIAEVAAARPMKAEVQDVYRKYAQALVDDARRQQVDESRRKMMERYALGPSVTVQKGGVEQGPPAAPATSEGLERTVKAHLPFLDVGLWRQQMFRLEGRVCRVEVGGSPAGTGFLVAPDLVLTNYHVLMGVITDPSLAAGVRMRFDYRVLGNGLQSDGTLAALAADWLVDHSPFTDAERRGQPDSVPPTPDELDYALVRLDRPLGAEPADAARQGEPRGWVNVPAAAPAVAPGMPLFILQHPLAQPLKLAIDTQGVQEVNPGGTRIRYATNTESGSSGSPCFDTNWGLVALHHYGDPAFKHPATYNQGIPIAAIRDRLRRVGKEGVLGGASP
ncbi:MAG TPA: trypsin-like peptidase domain-containing protein [Longimicrobium sp.]|jgi:hypothetical protein